MEKHKNMIKFPDFGQNYYSRTATSIYRNGHYSNRLMQWMACYDRYFENINYFNLMASVSTCLIEIS